MDEGAGRRPQQGDGETEQTHLGSSSIRDRISVGCSHDSVSIGESPDSCRFKSCSPTI